MVTNKGHALSRYELLTVLTVYQGITTSDGAADGSTLIDSYLIGKNDFITNKVILIGSGDAIYESGGALTFTAASGTIFVASSFSTQIVTGTVFRILNFPTGDVTIQILNMLTSLVSSLLVTTETGGVITTDGTEQDVYINDAPAGIFEPRTVKIDFTNQTAGETVVIKVYYRIRAGGDFIKQDEVTYVGIQDPELISIELEPNRFGVQVTIERTAGVARAYDWEVLYRA